MGSCLVRKSCLWCICMFVWDTELPGAKACKLKLRSIVSKTNGRNVQVMQFWFKVISIFLLTVKFHLKCPCHISQIAALWVRMPVVAYARLPGKQLIWPEVEEFLFFFSSFSIYCALTEEQWDGRMDVSTQGTWKMDWRMGKYITGVLN